MVQKNKRGMKKQLPPLCEAVRELRKAHGDTLERFSQRVGISLNSVSRFELGKAVPSDPSVLARLLNAASEKGLEYETTVFRDAIYVKGDAEQRIYSFRRPEPNLKEWRIIAAARILNTYYPQQMPKLLDSLRPALDLVDTVLQDLKDPGQIDYNELDRELTKLAERQMFMELQQELKKRRKDS
jgi:transcriptional regulator with XRE-family HTH domain